MITGTKVGLIAFLAIALMIIYLAVGCAASPDPVGPEIPHWKKWADENYSASGVQR